MIPQELKRDAHGMNRIERIEEADKLVAQARVMAAAFFTDPQNGFARFADEYCTECGSDEECGLHTYEDAISDAANFYREAGLGLLADRVEAVPCSDPVSAWAAFDEANLREDV